MSIATAAAPTASAQDLDLAEALEARVGRLWWELVRATPGDLSRTAASVLATLREHGSQRVTELADLESVSQPSMSTLVAQLERAGLVAVAPDPADGRAKRVSVTASGQTALVERAARRSAWLQPRLDRLGTDDRDRLVAALAPLERLIATTEQAA